MIAMEMMGNTTMAQIEYGGYDVLAEIISHDFVVELKGTV